MLSSVVTFVTAQPPRLMVVILLAPLNVPARVARLVVIHLSIPAPSNLTAPKNVFAMVVTFETSHFVRSLFIFVAPEKVLSRLTAAVVTHLLVPVPVEVKRIRGEMKEPRYSSKTTELTGIWKKMKGNVVVAFPCSHSRNSPPVSLLFSLPLPIPWNLLAPRNVLAKVVTLFTAQPPRFLLNLLAPENVFNRLVRAVVFHLFSPEPEKAPALWNVLARVVTLVTDHFPRSAFIDPEA